MLDTGTERLVLRQRGGHPFHDPVLESLVGRFIRGRGLLEGYTLILDEWEDIGEDET